VIGTGVLNTLFQIPTHCAVGMLFQDFSMGLSHQCGIQAGSKRIFCWGSGLFGELGDNLAANRWVPGPLAAPYDAHTWVSLQCGKSFTAAVRTGGDLFSWGLDSAGNLAQNVLPGTKIANPTLVVNMAGLDPFVQVAAGQRTMCARTVTLMIYCSGDGAMGQTGTGGSSTILQVVGPGGYMWGPYMFDNTVVAALTAAAPLHLLAWGLNDWGQGGAGNAGVNMMAPTTPTYVPKPFATYSIGRLHACGTDAGGLGEVYCIGDNTKGREPI
jgi:alpha-tubulin suppressor-like RCC1 family protein